MHSPCYNINKNPIIIITVGYNLKSYKTKIPSKDQNKGKQARRRRKRRKRKRKRRRRKKKTVTVEKKEKEDRGGEWGGEEGGKVSPLE